MAGQSVMIVGTITDSEGKTQHVTIQGVGASMPVGPGYGVPTPPDVIWGGRPPPTVAPPIYYPPVFPAHPIVPPGGFPLPHPAIYYAAIVSASSDRTGAGRSRLWRASSSAWNLGWSATSLPSASDSTG